MKSGRKTNDQEMEWRKKDGKEEKKGKKNKSERNWIMIKWYVEDKETKLRCQGKVFNGNQGCKDH